MYRDGLLLSLALEDVHVFFFNSQDHSRLSQFYSIGLRGLLRAELAARAAVFDALTKTHILSLQN